MTDITILAYNTHLFGGTVPGWFKSLDDNARTKAICGVIEQRSPQIVCLTEVWAESRSDEILSLLPSYYYHYRPPAASGITLSSGLLLVSKLPIKDPTFERFDKLKNYDSQSDKGFIVSEIHTPKGEMLCRLVLTHTQATYDNDPLQYQVVRTSEFSQIIRKIRIYPTDDVPWIIAGDLNVIAESNGYPTDEYKALKVTLENLGLLDMYRAMNPYRNGENLGLTLNGLTNPLVKEFEGQEAVNWAERLDYLWVSSSTKPFWKKCKVEQYAYTYHSSVNQIWPSSDHYPIEGTLTLR